VASKEEIKKAILDATNNPIIGVIVETVDDVVEAVYNLDNPPVIEVRVVVPEETR
jgi:hypothetical protein